MEVKVILTFLTIIALSKAGKVPSVGITGGREARPHSHPYQVGIFIPVSYGHKLCGGSLITPQTVLTAANCLDGILGPVEVVLGAHDINSTEEVGQVRVNSADISVHPDWEKLGDKTSISDIAVVRLPEPVELGEYIQVIKLADAADNSTDYAGLQGVVTGWGWVSDYVHAVSSALMEVTLSIVTNFSCEQNYFLGIDENNICVSGAGGKSACVGDSGGPLVIDNTQVAVFSKKSVLNCEEGWPMAYVKVAAFLDWINSHSI